MRSTRWLWLVLVAVLALVPAACGRDDERRRWRRRRAAPRRTRHHRHGRSSSAARYPFSGPASAYGAIAKGAKAYFEFVNAKGGVDGRKIEFITLDDGYEPQRALHERARLVEQDKVFAMFNTLGTPNNLAIWDYAQPAEGAAAVRRHRRLGLGRGHQGAPVHDRLAAQLRDRGQGLRASTSRTRSRTPRSPCSTRTTASARTCSAASRRRIEGSGHQDRRAGELRGDRPDRRVADAASWRASGADTFLNITTPKFSRAGDRDDRQDRLEAAAHPQQRRRVQERSCSSRSGSRTPRASSRPRYFKDPEDPQWADDAAMKEYKDGAEEVRAEGRPARRVHRLRLDGRRRRWSRRSSR